MSFVRSILPRFAAMVAAAGCLLSGCTRPPEADANRILFSIWGSVQQQRAEEEMLRAFTDKYPDLRVDLMVIGARYPEKIQAMFVGNVAPDVVMVNLNQYDEWATRGVLEDLTEDFHLLNAESEILPIPRRVVERNGRVFGLPINAHGQVTHYNKDALRAANIAIPEEGLSWKFIEEIAPRLSRRNGDPNAPTDYVMLMPSSSIIFWQFGARLFDDLFHPTKVLINSPESMEALDFIRRMRASGYAVPPEVAADEGTFQLFRDGRVAFYFNGRWMTPEFAGRTRFAWDVVPMPYGPVSNITAHGGTVLAVWKNSPRKDVARQFVRFYASPAGNRISMQWQRNVPIYREVAHSEEFFQLHPPESLHYFSQTMEEGAAQFNLYAPGVAEVGRLFDARVQQALSRPDMPSEDVLAGMEVDLNRWLARMRNRGVL